MTSHFPPFQWLKGYNLKTFNADTIAGITLTAYAIPVSLAYASLAGLPPQYGVFGYLLGGLFYAFLGSSRQMAIGPTSAISMLIGITLSSLSQGDTQRWLDLASLTAFVFAVMSILAYFLRLSSIINFISDTVLLGFKAGAALTIALTQLPKIFGVTGGGDNFFSRFSNLLNQLPDTNYIVLAFGVSAIILMVAGQRFFPGKPIAIIVVALSVILISFTPLGEVGIKTTGVIPAELPQLHFPVFLWSDVESIIPLALACFLLAYIESVSAAKAIAHKNGYEIDARQELLALGAANLAVSFGHGFPVSGGLSQSAVNEKAGAKTPLSLVICSVCIGVCLLFFTGLLKNLPTLILAAIVLVAVRGLIDIKEFKRRFQHNKFDFYLALFTMFCVISFGILYGVVFSALISLLLIIRMVSSPHVAFLGKIPGTNNFSDIKRHPDNETIPGVIIFRVESPIVYFNVNTIRSIVLKYIDSDKNVKGVLFDLNTSAYIDSSGATFIKNLFQYLKSKDIIFKVADAHSEVRDMLRKEEVEFLFGHIGRKDTLNNTLEHLLTEINKK